MQSDVLNAMKEACFARLLANMNTAHRLYWMKFFQELLSPINIATLVGSAAITFVVGVNLTLIKNLFVGIIFPDLGLYPYLNPPVFFSTGEALASIAVLLAVYQIKKEKWSIALKVRSYVEPLVFSLLFGGITLTIISAFILVKDPKNIFELSIFWQTTASVIVAASIIILFLKANNKNLFSEGTSRKFYEILVWELSRPDQERLTSILLVLLENFDEICCVAARNNQTDACKDAQAILHVVLGEGSLVDLITTKRLDALSYIFATIEKYKIRGEYEDGISALIKNLFLNHDSFFYKQIERNGIALSVNIFAQVFGSAEILKNHKLFGWSDFKVPSRIPDNLEIEVLIQALSTATETYLSSGQVPARHINDGFEKLSGIFGQLCTQIADNQEKGVRNKFVDGEWWGLHLIAQFLGHDYAFLPRRDGVTINVDVANRESVEPEVSFYADTIGGAIAATIYKAFEQLSYIDDKDDSFDTYHIGGELLHGVEFEGGRNETYRAALEKRIWIQIGRNIKRRHFPAVTRPYLNIMGHWLASDDTGGLAWPAQQAERLRRLLYVDLKPLLDANTKMVNDNEMSAELLPKSVFYQNGEFFRVIGFKRGNDKQISRPLERSESALSGVELDARTIV